MTEWLERLRQSRGVPAVEQGERSMTADAKAVWNEQRKLTSVTIYNVGIAIMVTGVVVPVVSGQIDGTFVRVAQAVWAFAIGILLHVLARNVLEGVRG